MEFNEAEHCMKSLEEVPGIKHVRINSKVDEDGPERYSVGIVVGGEHGEERTGNAKAAAESVSPHELTEVGERGGGTVFHID